MRTERGPVCHRFDHGFPFRSRKCHPPPIVAPGTCRADVPGCAGVVRRAGGLGMIWSSWWLKWWWLKGDRTDWTDEMVRLLQSSPSQEIFRHCIRATPTRVELVYASMCAWVTLLETVAVHIAWPLARCGTHVAITQVVMSQTYSLTSHTPRPHATTQNTTVSYGDQATQVRCCDRTNRQRRRLCS